MTPPINSRSPIVRALYRCAEEGLTANQATARVGCSPKHTRDSARRHGFEYAPAPSVLAEKVRACAEAGMTAWEAADHLGVDRGTTHRIGRREGFEFDSHAKRLRRAKEEAAKEALERSRQQAMVRWRLKLETRRLTSAPLDPSDPVSIVLAHLAKAGRISEAAAMRMPPEILGAAMARVRPGNAAEVA